MSQQPHHLGCAAAGDVTNPNETKYTLEYYLNMADAIVEHGCHSIGIKDMAGLLKPKAATLLIGALRAAHPDVVLHVHTHDSAGTAVATQLAAAAAGADMVDLAMDAMSGCTSQVRLRLLLLLRFRIDCPWRDLKRPPPPHHHLLPHAWKIAGLP